jgi:hypothetical protein
MIVRVRTSYVMLGQVNPGSFRLYQVRFGYVMLVHVSSFSVMLGQFISGYLRLFQVRSC